MCFLLSLWNWKTSKEGKDGKVGVGLIILHMPSDNCNNAHVTELRCVIIGNFRFSNRYQSEEHEMASFKVQVMCHWTHKLCPAFPRSTLASETYIAANMSMSCGPLSPHFLYEPRREKKRVIGISK